MAISTALLALPARLRSRGLTIVEMPGWQTRDRNDGGFKPFGIVDHHDGMGLDGTNVAQNMSRDGQNGAQIWIRRDGTVYMLAAGRMWHSGVHNAWGDFAASSANLQAVGIETDYKGSGPWPPALLASWRVVRHELASLLGMTAQRVGRRMAGHKEIAPGRKTDPAGIDMDAVRRDLIADLAGLTPPISRPPDTAPQKPSAPIDPEVIMAYKADIVFFTHKGVTYAAFVGQGVYQRMWTPQHLTNFRWFHEGMGARVKYWKEFGALSGGSDEADDPRGFGVLVPLVAP